MKIIFLDFDGPIIPLLSYFPEHRGIMEKAWPPCVAALNRITDATGARIVVSSAWRIQGNVQDSIDHLRNWGVTGEVIDVTPDLTIRDQMLWKSVDRGVEIAAWMNGKDVEAFVILDDEFEMQGFEHIFIKTPFEVGLTEADADLAISMLNERG